MNDQYSLNPHLLLPQGTRVVVKVDAIGTNGKALHPAGALAVIVQTPLDHQHGATEAAAFVKRIDFKPSKIAFDAQFDR